MEEPEKTCPACQHYARGGCVHPLSDRDFHSEDKTACELFHAARPVPIAPRVLNRERERDGLQTQNR